MLTSDLCAGLIRMYPSYYELGVLYQGALVEGSFRVVPADGIQRVYIDVADDQEVIHLESPVLDGQNGVIYKFQVRTDRPGVFLLFLQIETERGIVKSHFGLEIRPDAPRGEVLLFCSSPFDSYSDHHVHKNLSLMLRALEAQINSTDELPADLSQFQTIVLMEAGLRALLLRSHPLITSKSDIHG